MTTWKRIRDNLLNGSKQISFEQIHTLLKHYGYQIDYKGKTSGSRVLFHCVDKPDIYIHKPHPAKELNRACLCLLYTSPSPRDQRGSRMPSSA